MARKAKYVSNNAGSRGGAKGAEPDRDTRAKLTDDELKSIKEAFELFDSDNSGTIDPKEIEAALASLGDRSSTIFRLLAGIEELGADITLEDFTDHIAGQLGNRNSRDGVQKILDLFDNDGTNTINIENLVRVSRELGETMSEEELLEAIKKSSGGKNELTLDDFYAVMTKKINV